MDHTRHMNIFNANQLVVTMVGAGSVGSYAALALAKMGVGWLDIYDNDRVEEENVSVQLYGGKHIGQPKVYALGEVLIDLADTAIGGTVVTGYYSHFVSGECGYADILISCVDSIKSRQEIWRAIRTDYRCEWYLDTRMGPETFQVYAVKMSDLAVVEQYEEMITCLDDEMIPDDVCTAKATPYTAMGAAMHIANAVRRIVTGDPIPVYLDHNIQKDLVYRV